MPAGGDGGAGRRSYQREVHEDLHAVSWSHVGHVVEVGGVRDQLVPHLWISQHLSGNTNTKRR